MINKERIVDEFCELVAIDAPTYQEHKLADVLKNKLEEIRSKEWNNIAEDYETYIAEVAAAQSALQHIRKELHLKDDSAYNQMFGKSF